MKFKIMFSSLQGKLISTIRVLKLPHFESDGATLQVCDYWLGRQ